MIIISMNYEVIKPDSLVYLALTQAQCLQQPYGRIDM